MPKSLKKKVVLFLKVAVTLGFCGIIFAKADWPGLWAAIRNVNRAMIAVVVVCMLLNVVISAKKWQVLLSIHRMDVQLYDLTKYYFTGMFFGNFLPSTIGGDGYRMYKIFNINRSMAEAVVPVVVERLSGMAMLLFLGFLTAIISFRIHGDMVSEAGLLFGLCGTIAAILVTGLVFNRRVQIWIESLSFVPARVKNILGYLDGYRRNRLLLLQCVAISILFYLFLFAYRYLLLVAVGETCSFSSFAVVTMLSTVIASLPISINGIGLMDGSFIYLISSFGVGYEAAFTFMLLQRALTTAISLVGGLIYLKNKEVLKTPDSRDEEIRQLKETVF